MIENRLKSRLFVLLQFGIAAVVVLAALVENSLTNRFEIKALTIVSIISLVLGAVIVLLALVAFRQRITPNPIPLDASELRTGGIYRFIRHPMYTSVIFVFIGITLYLRAYYSFILNVGAVIFLLTKISFEEKQLLEKFPEYKAYRSRTKKLIPFIY